MIGKVISPTLEELENALWDFEAKYGVQPNYTTEGFRAALKIFMSALMDKIWNLQEAEGISMPDRGVMVEKCGTDFRNLIKTYTNIDPHDLY